MPFSVPMMPHDSAKVRVCVDKVQYSEPYGTIWSSYLKEPMVFRGIMDLVNQLEKKLWLPQNSHQYRTFRKRGVRAGRIIQRRDVQVNDEEIIQTKMGEKATFITQIQFRQNATWQGTIQWVERKRTQRFRSTLEMIKLMDSAMAETISEENAGLPSEWDEE